MNNQHHIDESVSLRASANPGSTPKWLRLAVTALATIILCSCRSDGQRQNPLTHYSIGQSERSADPQDQRRHAAQPVMPVDDGVQQAQYAAAMRIPSHLTPRQVSQASHEIIGDGYEFGNCSAGCCPAPSSAPTGSCPSGSCSAQGCGCDIGPIRGPNDEYLCDGGDFGLQAGVNTQEQELGLEQEDTVAHYQTIDGRTIVTPSNKVCIYAPRFGAVRRVVDALGSIQNLGPRGVLHEAALVKAEDNDIAIAALTELGPNVNRRQEPPSLIAERLNPRELDRDRDAREQVGLLAPEEHHQLVEPRVVSNREMVEIARSSLAAVSWAGIQAPQIRLNNKPAQAAVSDVSPGTIYKLKEPNSPKLRLIKLASTGAALPGEEIQFTLQYKNIGDVEIDRVTIVDNLTTRLEYVAGSQKSNRKATFVTDPNDGGSLVLKWLLAEPLGPGDGGEITFHCKVR